MMTRHAFTLDPERTTPSRSGDKRCFIFHWVGQTFMSCEECGEPDFVHPYRPVYGNGRPDFFIKRYHRRYQDNGFWSWEAVKINEHYDHERALIWCGPKGERDAER